MSQTFASVLESWCLQGADILRLGTKGWQSLSPICQPATISVTYRLPLRFCCGGLVPSRSLLSFASAPRVSSKNHPATDLQPSLSPIGCPSLGGTENNNLHFQGASDLRLSAGELAPSRSLHTSPRHQRLAISFTYIPTLNHLCHR